MFSCEYSKIFNTNYFEKQAAAFQFFQCFTITWTYRSKLYDNVRLQGPIHRLSFLFLSRHLWFWRESQPAFEKLRRILFFFFSISVFFHAHSRFTGQQGKEENIYLTPLYHFHPLHRNLDFSRAIQRAHPCT